MYKYLVTLATSAFLLAGCASDRALTLDPAFGNAVKQNIAEQTINPMGQPADASATMDGQKAQQAVDRYRKGPAETKDESLVRDIAN